MGNAEETHTDLLVQKVLARLHPADQQMASVALPALESIAAPGFAADEATQRLLASLVHELAPRHVLELGCGVSTELLALLGFAHGRLAVTTYEHDPWAAEELLNAASPIAINYRWFAFSLCPLVARLCHGTRQPVYDDRMTVSTVPYPADLVLISGPPAELGGRGGTIYQALTLARPGAVILLLDVRPDEEPMLAAWQRDLSPHLSIGPGQLLDRHQAFVVREPLLEPFALERPRAQMSASAGGD